MSQKGVWFITEDLAGHALLLQKRIHDEQGVAGDETVGPAVRVAVEVNGLAQRRIFLAALEQRRLLRQAVAIAAAHGLDDGARVNALVHVQGGGVHLKGAVLLFARPDELRREVGVVVERLAQGGHGLDVIVSLVRGQVGIGLRVHQADGRIVDALLAGMLVGLDRALAVLLLRFFGGGFGHKSGVVNGVDYHRRRQGEKVF